METTSIKLYSLNYNDTKTYLATLLFVVGNMALPQLFHLIPQGGITWLPIYFFTLIGAYKYGLLFGMPQPVILPAILLKSTLLAIAAGYAAHRYKRISIPILLLVVSSYQVVGTLGEWILVNDFFSAVQDFRIGLPGMALQIFGGYLFISRLIYK